MNSIGSVIAGNPLSNDTNAFLRTEVMKLTTRLDSVLAEQESQLDLVRNELTNSMQQFTNDTRNVFDAVMKDIDSL